MLFNDIALIELEHPLEFDDLKWPICLPKNYDYAMEDRFTKDKPIIVSLVGWGVNFGVRYLFLFLWVAFIFLQVN